MGYHPDMPETTSRSTSAHGADHGTFRHSYTKDKAQLSRRLSRVEGQVRGIARMIERDEYCIDILQQTAALRAAVDAVSIMILEDHVQGCVRTAAERGEADRYVDEVVDVVRRTLGRPVRGTKSAG
jgi:CsoR family transcriptional regulator, copper-sensing transcriptional repressor